MPLFLGRTCGVLASAVVLTLLSSRSFADSVYTDGTFNNIDWTLITEGVGIGGSASASQQPAGGNPGAYRQVTTNVNTAGSGSSFIFAFNEKVAATYDPTVQGAITSIDYSEDSILVQGFGDGQITGIALAQNGTIYYDLDFKANSFAWTPNSETGLTSADFLTAAYYAGGPVTHPDFSVSTAPITFGFVRVDSQAAGGGGYSIVGGIDNWSVDVHSAPLTPVTPLPSSAWSGLVLLGGIGLLTARRKFSTAK